MRPKHLVESLKLTYDLAYAREIARQMVAAAYPQATLVELPDLMRQALQGFQLGALVDGVTTWSLADVEDFIQRYQAEFQKNGDSLICYVMVHDLLMRIAERTAELTPALPEGLPFWFKNSYLRPLFAVAPDATRITGLLKRAS